MTQRKVRMEELASLDSWGTDPSMLFMLQGQWPFADRISSIQVGQCHYPLWNLRQVDRQWTTDFGATDTHRYVCAAPVDGPLDSYCVACSRRTYNLGSNWKSNNRGTQ